MIKNVTITNKQTYEQIEIGAKAPFVLDSIDWGSASVEQTSYRVPFQIGEFKTGEVVGIRQISIVGYVVADDVTGVGKSWKQYYEDCEKKIEENKLLLDKLFSIYYNVSIETGEYRIEGVPTTAVKYSTNEEDNNEVFCMFSVVLKCFNPMFVKGGTKQTQLATTSGKLHFPLIIKHGGVVFGEIIKRRSVPILNSGDSDAGCVITIFADGGIVKDPKIYIIQTEEFLEFKDVTLRSGDYITVTTETGKENVIWHDASETKEINVIGHLTNDSKFIKIKKGTYDYAYSVDEQYMSNVDVKIEFEEQYFNIRGM
jgi:hypothetical protein